MWTGVTEELREVKLIKCYSTFCPLQVFKKIYDPIIPSKKEMNCLVDEIDRKTLSKKVNKL